MASGVRKACLERPRTDNEPLSLPHPFPEYVTCPHCGELEVEVWCYETHAICHRCGGVVEHEQMACESQCLVEQTHERAVQLPPSAVSGDADRSESAAGDESD